jgi:acyl dehydratase
MWATSRALRRRRDGERMSDDFRTRARLVPKGNRYEDFEPGRVFKHHWGRTLTESESTLFSTLTLHFNPHYFNAAYARAHGHSGLVVNPLLVFTTVFGLTVEDLSEGGGPFLGVNQLTYHQHVYPGDSLHAESIVLDRRVSESQKGFGIVTWHTRGFNQRDELAIDFKRTNLVRTRESA